MKDMINLIFEKIDNYKFNEEKLNGLLNDNITIYNSDKIKLDEAIKNI